MRSEQPPKPGVDVEEAIAKIREKLEYEYRARIREADEKLAHAKEITERSGFYAGGTTFKQLTAFSLVGTSSHTLGKDELGKLVVAFNERFSGYSLFVHQYCSNDRRNDYELYVIRSITTCSSMDEHKIPRDEDASMRDFVRGFAQGRRSFRKQVNKSRY